MGHGIEEYYRERLRFERRVSMTTLAVAACLLALQGLLLVPSFRQATGRALSGTPLDPRRFGFEGPEQYVRRIILESAGPLSSAPGKPTVVFRSAQATKGGRADAKPSTHPNARPDTRRPGVGAGESVEDLVARARIRFGGSAPVMQSEDLIIERLVKPVYPEDAQIKGIEGRVALVALVDTVGEVRQVDLMSSTGERQLEEAATSAVMQCRFRPYKVRGRTSEVYAVFRFSFRIY